MLSPWRAAPAGEVRYRAQSRNGDGPANDAKVEPVAGTAQIGRGIDDVVARVAGAEIGAAAHIGTGVAGTLQVLPLDAELGRAIGADFDDQRFHEHLRATIVELLHNRADVVVNRLRRHDQQRVVRGVGLDRHATGRESTPPPLSPPPAAAKAAKAAAPPCGAHRGAAHAAARGAQSRRPRDCRQAGARSRVATAARQQRAQRCRNTNGLRVLQVDDENIPAGAPLRIELLE